MHMQNQTGKKGLFFASHQCKTALLCINTGRHGKTEIHSGSTTFLQPRFDTIKLLFLKLKEMLKGQRFSMDVEVLAANGYAANQNLSTWIE
ncbi:hypothetical protein TNCV_4792771 [Trichonephila clavipes]|nr:hypothetical protein TNCV_4792771 [Trichonephila clavipes]